MTNKEILAVISQMEEQLATLKAMVATNEAEPQVVSTPKEEEISQPREEVVTKSKSKKIITHDDEVILGCSIINTLPDFYRGKCNYLKLRKRSFDNGKEKLYIDKYHCIVEAYDIDDNLLGNIVTHWNNLSEWHLPLIALGINTHKGANWTPCEVMLSVD